VGAIDEEVDPAPIQLGLELGDGQAIAVGLVMWLAMTSRVRSVTAARIASSA
jgi:hypothetical protein